MNDDKKQTELESITSELVSNVKPYSSGAILVGTMAHSKNYMITPGSDIDTIVFCEPKDIKKIINKSSIYKDYTPASLKLAFNYLNERVTDIVSTRHEKDGCLITVHYMNDETFVNKFSNGKKSNTLYSFRKIPKNYVYQFKGFSGNSIPIKVENYVIKGGFKVPMKTSIYQDDKYYSGSPHNKLMSNPIVLFDKNNFINESIDNLHSDLIERLIYEQGINVDNELFSICNTLVRQHKIRPDILQILKNKEKTKIMEVIKNVKK